MQDEVSTEQAKDTLGITDILASMRQRADAARERLVANKSRILGALKKIKATHVTVSYSGSGDSGQIDSVEIFQDKSVLKPARKVSVLVATSYFDGEQSRWVENVKPKAMPLSEALEQLVYDWLESEYAGWENNDGASGECTVEIAKAEFLLSHTTYYTESETAEHSL